MFFAVVPARKISPPVFTGVEMGKRETSYEAVNLDKIVKPSFRPRIKCGAGMTKKGYFRLFTKTSILKLSVFSVRETFWLLHSEL